MTECLNEIKAAIHLNNVGVTLLQRFHYRQAVMTLNDAVEVIKYVSLKDEQTTGKTTYVQPINILPMDIESKVKAAEERMFVVDSSDRSKHNTPVLTTLSDDTELHTLIGLRNPFTHLVRMEPSISDLLAMQEKGIAVESSTILYNYGVAYLCLAGISQTALMNDGNNFCLGAYRMFHLSYATLMSSKTLESDVTCCPGRIEILTYLLLGNLSSLAGKLGRAYDQQEYGHRFSMLHDFLCTMDYASKVVASPAA